MTRKEMCKGNLMPPKPPRRDWWYKLHLESNKIDQSKLMVMPANNSSAIVHFWAGKFPGRIGWLIGPSALPKTSLRPWIPFHLDNDAFSAWTKEKPWSESAWKKMLDDVRSTGLRPRWALIPDKVTDRDETLRLYEKHNQTIRDLKWPVAFACQDGMTPEDVPQDADVLFIGGSTKWKWESLPMWSEMGKRVHVGRVNEVSKLLLCESLGVESVDGTGWMRGTFRGRQATDLANYLASKP